MKQGNNERKSYERTFGCTPEAATPAAERSPLWQRAVQPLTRAADASGMNLVMMTGRMMCGFGEPWAPSGISRSHNPWAVDIFFPGRPRRDEAVSNCQSLLVAKCQSLIIFKCFVSMSKYFWVCQPAIQFAKILRNGRLECHTTAEYSWLLAFFKGGFFRLFGVSMQHGPGLFAERAGHLLDLFKHADRFGYLAPLVLAARLCW